MTQENNVIEAEFTEVTEEVVEAAEVTEEVAAEETQAQPEQQPVILLGKTILPRETGLLGSALISHTLNLLSETGAVEKFEKIEDYLGYIKAKVNEILYVVLPAGSVVEVTVTHDEEANQINVNLKLNTEAELEVYSDRVQVLTFVKVR